MTRARRKPYDPALATRLAFERREREAEIVRLQRQGAEVKLDPARRVISARLSNVFNLLLTRGTITQSHHDAAYTLAQLWAAWKGLDGKGDAGERVDGGQVNHELVSDRMLKAGRRLYGDERGPGIFPLLSAPHARLLTAFMVATVEEDRPMAWRGLVQRETGEERRIEQASVVVDALEALREITEGAPTQDRVASCRSYTMA